MLGGGALHSGAGTVCDPSLLGAGLLSSIAGAMRMDARAAQCLVDLLEAHTSVQGLLAW